MDGPEIKDMVVRLHLEASLLEADRRDTELVMQGYQLRICANEISDLANARQRRANEQALVKGRA